MSNSNSLLLQLRHVQAAVSQANNRWQVRAHVLRSLPGRLQEEQHRHECPECKERMYQTQGPTNVVASTIINSLKRRCANAFTYDCAKLGYTTVSARGNGNMWLLIEYREVIRNCSWGS
jgi:hypothetical protein